jgi:glyoxylase-like metal-dependent hydrolase (beta-lactamase superfamily II)
LSNLRSASVAEPETLSSRHAWIEPGVEAVAPDVWRIPLPLPEDGLRAVNVYALRDGDGLTMVDAGWALAEARTALVAALGTLGAGLGDIRRFLVTHMHRDHYTNAIAVRREFGTTVLLGEGEQPSFAALSEVRPFSRQAERLAQLGAKALSDLILSRIPANAPRDDIWEAPDRWIGGGERFEVGERRLEAIPTPGHTRGHLVFADHEAGLLFAGDHVLPHITPSIGFEAHPPAGALRTFLRSLTLIRELPDMVLLPAHGPAGGRVHARIDELVAHHAHRLDEMAQQLRTGWRTAYEVASEIGWTRRAHRLDDLDTFNQMLAIFETALHLDLLVAQGLVVVKELDGVRQYGLTPGPPVEVG